MCLGVLWRAGAHIGSQFGIVAVLLNVLSCSDPVPPLKIDKGQSFPVLAVQSLQGEPKSILMPSDKVTVLNIWATWCGPCRYEMPSLQALADQLDPRRFQVIGVSIDDDIYPTSEFLIERKIQFTNYHDPVPHAIKKLLGLRAFPTTYLLIGERVFRVVEGGQDWRSPEWLTLIRSLGNTLN